ncbi:hypothetical protein FGO68_gene7239 [Halteria grandinella]|uniref:Ankyrin repeat domain-containing protein n=1 Tax=Halteria grandinella TaxID=5974 RepID=A0A8J8SXT6_HALGN|nr:hypothetical protein FGO68_gene7239 [Halteria grandinella]
MLQQHSLNNSMNNKSSAQKENQTEEALRYIDTGDLQAFQELLEKTLWYQSNGGASPLNNSGKQTRSPKQNQKFDEWAILMRIVKTERVEFLKEILIKQAFTVTQKDVKTGDSILHIAAFQGKIGFVKAMLLNQPQPLFELEEINIKNEDGNTPLSYASLKGNLELVKLLHSKGASVVHKNSQGLSPLMLAIYQSHYFVVHYLLSIEAVYDSVGTALELFKCLQFSISSICGGSSSQIFYLLFEVFESKIDDIFGQFQPQITIWDMKVNPSQEADLVTANGLINVGSTLALLGDQGLHHQNSYYDQSNSLIQQHAPGSSVGGYTLLHYACSSGNYEIFDYILLKLTSIYGSLKKALLDRDNPSKEVPLHWAVLRNHQKLVKRLIQEHRIIAELLGGEDSESQQDEQTFRGILDIENANQQTPFFVAIIKGFLGVAELLSADGMSRIDTKDMIGDTPLHWAVMLGNQRTVDFLLDFNELNIDCQNIHAYTPLMVACTNSHTPLIKTLIQNKAQVNKENHEGMTPLHAACLAGNIKAVDLLLEQSEADFMRKDKSNMIPMHYAVIKDQAKLIRHLQQERHFSVLQRKYFYQADPNSSHSLTLMALAVLNGSYNTIKLLAEEWGESLESRDPEGNTYLHLAAMSGHVSVFMYLLSTGRLSYQSKNTRGKTAIQLAKMMKNEHIIDYLQEIFGDANMLTGKAK